MVSRELTRNSSWMRRFDIEHTFRMIKQTLGWTTPCVRHPATADLWTWLITAAHTQLRLARPPRRRPTPPLGTPREENSSPRPASGEGFATSAGRRPVPQLHRNRAGPALDARPAAATSTRTTSRTSARP